MITETAYPERLPAVLPVPFFISLFHSLRLSLIVALVMAVLAAVFQLLFAPTLAALKVDETFTTGLASGLIGLLPSAFYLAAGAGVRTLRQHHFGQALLSALIVAALGYAVFVAYQSATGSGAFRQIPALGVSFRQAEGGIEVTEVQPGSDAESAGIQVGDLITALRRDPINVHDLQTRLRDAQADDVFRFRITRGGEELQLATHVILISVTDTGAIGRGLLIAFILVFLGLAIPVHWAPHMLLLALLVPLLTGYLWLIVATFSTRTHGLFPVDAAGNIGGWTLDNWRFLTGTNIGGPTVDIWTVTLNSLVVAVAMTITSLLFCSMAGYALSRMAFPGRRTFLSMMLVLHGFPAVTLIIPVFLVLINLGNIPILGSVVGYNKPGGIALVMIAFELPLGVWLIKGFFDGISWDMERSALIDGASRWRAFWEIVLPQIRPGLLALGIFSFISGWNAYLIPATYSVGTGLATLPVYINQLSGELAPVNWNQVAAVGLFQLIPIIIFFVFAQEYLLNIYAGGTKGSS